MPVYREAGDEEELPVCFGSALSWGWAEEGPISVGVQFWGQRAAPVAFALRVTLGAEMPPGKDFRETPSFHLEPPADEILLLGSNSW